MLTREEALGVARREVISSQKALRKARRLLRTWSAMLESLQSYLIDLRDLTVHKDELVAEAEAKVAQAKKHASSAGLKVSYWIQRKYFNIRERFRASLSHKETKFWRQIIPKIRFVRI